MRILVTGGSGFIGSNLVQWILKQTDHDVLNVDCLTYAGNLASNASIANHPRYRFSQTDITDRESLRHLLNEFRPEALMHLAAESHVDRSIDGPGQFIQTNVVGTYVLLESVRQYLSDQAPETQQRFRFHHVSTDEVYGSLDLQAAGFSESTPYDPHSPYSASKAASDHLVRSWHRTYGVPVLITNCSNNYGPYQFPEKLVPVVILNALAERSIPVYGDGSNVRDWLYVEDHCEALCRVLERGTPGRTYNIGGNHEQSNLELVRLICRLLDEIRPRPGAARYEELITFVQDRPGHDLRYAIDATRIREELGWEPRQGLADGFRKTVLWYLANEDWWQSLLSGDSQPGRQGLGSSVK